MKKYTFQMTEQDVRELWLKMIGELLYPLRFNGLLLLVIMVVECMVFPWTAIIFLLVPGIFAVFMVRNYFKMKKQLCKETRTMWAEDGRLKLRIGGGAFREYTCSDITMVRKTRHLLMLGAGQASKITEWYFIPLQVFEDEQARDMFVESVWNSQIQTQEEATVSTVEESKEAEYFRFSFQIWEEEWIRVTSEATEIIQAGTLGKQKKGYLIWTGLVVLFFFLSGWTVWRFSYNDKFLYFMLFILFVGAFMLLDWLRNRLGNPENKIREQVRKGRVRKNVWGDWTIVFTETGIWQEISGKSKILIPWENLFCVAETDTGLFFYWIDKKNFFVLPRWSMEWGQIERLKELCREKQVEVLAGIRKKYVPGWFFPALKALVIVGFLVAILWQIIWNPQGGATSEYVPFDEQISVLRSVGFYIPEELEEIWRGDLEDDEMAEYMERIYPYTWILTDLAWSEEAGPVWDSVGVFWFDFEGWDISADYVWVLEGMRGISVGSILDDVENIREDTEDVDWEKGTGTITVSLEWRGQEYSWKMNMEHDWIDGQVLDIYNGLLEKEGVPERFYSTGDGGQGALVFYCTKEWALLFEDATGLDLESYTLKKGW